MTPEQIVQAILASVKHDEEVGFYPLIEGSQSNRRIVKKYAEIIRYPHGSFHLCGQEFGNHRNPGLCQLIKDHPGPHRDALGTS